MIRYYKADEVEKLLSCGCAYAIRDLPSIEVSENFDKDTDVPINEDCISREWVLEEFEKGRKTISKSEYFDELVWLVIHAPSVVPSKAQGHYIKGENGEWYCSNCKRIDDKYSVAKFCWHCGARMKEVDDE